MVDPLDPSSRRLLNYHQAEEPTRWSLTGVAARIGWVALGFSVLCFIDPYLPELHVLMLLPICAAVAGLTLAVLALQKPADRRSAWLAVVPNVLALVIPAISIFVRWIAPVRWQ